MRYKICNETQKTKLEKEEYLPLQINFDVRYYKSNCIIYEKGTRSVLEFMLDDNTKKIRSITLLICEEVNRLPYNYPPVSAREGNIYLADEVESYGQNIVTDVFTTNIYKNAVELVLGSSPVSQYIKCDEVFWGLGEDMELKRILVYMDDEHVEHTSYELTF